MFIRVSNKLYIENPTLPIIDYCSKVLTIDNPTYLIALKLGKRTSYIPRTINLYERNGDTYVLPFGCLDKVWELYPIASAYKCDIKPLQANSLIGKVNLYPYQEKALNAMLHAKNGILVAPCGSGKTEIGVALIKAIGGKALWLTHTSDLLRQSKERAERYFKGDFGTITEGQVNVGQDITFATIQTMSKIDLEQYKNMFSVIIVDEASHCVGSPTKVRMFYKVLSALSARYKYGLTATPHRADNLMICAYSLLGDKVYKIFDSECPTLTPTYEPLMITTTIPKVCVGEDLVTHEPTYREPYIDTDGTIIYSSLIKAISENEPRNTYIAHLAGECMAQGKHIIILCSLITQVKALVRAINGSVELIGSTPKKERERVLKGENNCIVATYALAKEGLDKPILDTLILASPQKDYAIVKQSVGRIKRYYKGKTSCVVYDIVDSNIGYCLGAFTKRRRIINGN